MAYNLRSFGYNKGVFNISYNQNSNDFGIEVTKYLASRGIVKKGTLINYLLEKHPRGYSLRTINRKLKQMADADIVVILNSDQIKEYGIKDLDRREKYVVLKEFTKIKEHVDSVFKLFEDGDSEDKLSALAEIGSYKKNYALNPLQLDILARSLNAEDIELTYQLLVNIYYYIIDKKTKPNDTSAFLENLKQLLTHIPSLSQKRPALRGYIIALLGMYNDKAVVDQLIQDANTMEQFCDVKDEYDKIFTAKVIETHRTELFNLERSLRKNGKEKTAKVLSQIRFQAKKNCGIADVDNGISVPGVDF
jgi:hypothetical protein